jgi:hypothetical protein
LVDECYFKSSSNTNDGGSVSNASYNDNVNTTTNTSIMNTVSNSSDFATDNTNLLAHILIKKNQMQYHRGIHLMMAAVAVTVDSKNPPIESTTTTITSIEQDGDKSALYQFVIKRRFKF